MAIDPNKKDDKYNTNEFKELLDKCVELKIDGHTVEAYQTIKVIEDLLKSEIAQIHPKITQTSAPAEVNSNSSEQSPK